MRFLTTRQCAGLLQCSEWMVRKMCQDGTIGAMKVGTQWRIPERQFERMEDEEREICQRGQSLPASPH